MRELLSEEELYYPLTGFDSALILNPETRPACITPSRGFDSSDLMQKAMDWFSITPARGLILLLYPMVSITRLRGFDSEKREIMIEDREQDRKQNRSIAILIVIVTTVLIITSTALGIIGSMNPMVTGEKCSTGDHCMTMAQK